MFTFSEVVSFLCNFVIFVWKILYLTIFDVLRECCPKNRKSVRGEIMLITGGGHGLGKELAIAFAELGAIVIVWSKTKSRVDETINTIRDMGGTAYGYDIDVSDELKVAELAERVREEVGDVTILVNNAAVLNGKSIFNLSCEEIRRTINVNLCSHFWTIKQFFPKMKELKRGHIVAISSIAAFFGSPYLSDYSATKFALRGMMSSLKEELYIDNCEDSILLTTVCPIFFDSGMVKKPVTKYPWILPVLPTSEVCQKTMDAILKNQDLIVIPTTVHLILWLSEVFLTASVKTFVSRSTGCKIEI